jgi:PAS domain S-box-containing protein
MKFFKEDKSKDKNENVQKLSFRNNFVKRDYKAKLRGCSIYSGRKRRKSIENSQDFLQIIAKESPYIFYVRDVVKNNILYINEALFGVFGYTLEEFWSLDRGQIFEKFHPEDIPKVYAYLEKFEQIDQHTFFQARHELEVRIQNCNQEYVYTHIIEKPYIWNNNKALVIGIARDITENKLAEELILKKDKLQQGLANSLNILLTIENYERAVTLALACLGLAAEVDRIYVYDFHTIPGSSTPYFFEWKREGAQYYSGFASANGIDIKKDFPFWYEELQKGNMIMGHIKDLLPERQLLFNISGVKSYLIIPILRHGDLKGYIGCDVCHAERNWDASEITTLSTAAAGFGSFFEQQREQKLKEMAYDELRISESEIRQQAINLIKLQAKLKDIAEFNKNLFESSKNGLGVLSDGKITDINNAALALFGFEDRNEMLGLYLTTFCPVFQPGEEPSSTLFEQYLQATLEKGSVIFEFVCLRNQSSNWYAEFHLMKFIHKGRPLVQFSVRDITYEKKAMLEIHNKNIALQQREAELKSTIEDLSYAKAQLREALAIAEKQKNEIRALINSLEELTFAVDRNFNFLYANDALKKLFTFDATQQISQFYNVNIVFADEWPTIKNYITKAFKGEVVNAEIRYHFRNLGQIKYYNMSFSPIRNDYGEVTGVVVIAKDISKLKVVQHEIEEKNLQLEKQRLQLKRYMQELQLAENIAKEQRNQIYSIINSAEDIIIAVDKNFTITYYNNAFALLLKKFKIGLKKGDKISDIISQKHWGPIEKLCKEVLQGSNIAQETKLEIEEKIYYFHQTINPIRDSQNQVIGIISIAKDITKLKNAQFEIENKNEELKRQKNELAQAFERLKAAQAQLVHAEKMSSLGLLTAGIAHEINNPINFINGGIDALKENLELILEIIDDYATLEKDPTQILEQLQNIQAKKERIYFNSIREITPKLAEQIKIGSSRTAEIVRGLRNFSRLEEAKIKMVDIHEGIDSSLLLLNSKIKDKIQIIRNYDTRLPLIECYPGQLNQVFMNLLSNAIDAIEAKNTKKGLIIIATSNIEGKMAQIAFQDNGIGIDNAIIERIFEPFYTTKEIGKGTGLGLSISYGIIKNHNGQINVSSVYNEGSTFTITIPIRLQKQDEPSLQT